MLSKLAEYAEALFGRRRVEPQPVGWGTDYLKAMMQDPLTHMDWLPPKEQDAIIPKRGEIESMHDYLTEKLGLEYRHADCTYYLPNDVQFMTMKASLVGSRKTMDQVIIDRFAELQELNPHETALALSNPKWWRKR